MHRVLAYLHDGYTRTGYVSGRRHLHPPLRFEYRPVLVQNRSVILHQIERLAPDDADRLAAEMLTKQLVCWDLKDQHERTVEISVPHLLRLEPNLFTRLFEIVIGTAATDEDPDWSEDDKAERQRRALARALSGATPESEEETDLGNSPRG